MNEIKPFDIVTSTFPQFAAWVEEFMPTKWPLIELYGRAGVLPTLDYLGTKHASDSGLFTILLGYYLAKSELATTADPHANRVVLH